MVFAAVCLVEWPDRLGKATPAAHLAVHIEHGGPAAVDERTVTLQCSALHQQQQLQDKRSTGGGAIDWAVAAIKDVALMLPWREGRGDETNDSH